MAWSKNTIAVCMILLSSSGLAQVNRYMVFFKDKAGTNYQISQPLQFLSQRAIDRRIQQGIPVTQADLPVNANYIKAVREVGANTFFSTRWMNGVLVQ